MRRFLLAFFVSLAVHVLLVAVAIGVGVWRTLSLVPAVKMQAITVEVKDLPLGGPPPREAEEKEEPPARKPKVRHRAAPAHEGVTVPSPKDAGAEPGKPDAGPAPRPHDGGAGVDGGRRRPGDLRESGPEGSRLIALLRLDRLRASVGSEKTIAAIDQLLVLLPDRRRLVEGSGFDLYRDFDTLIVATPNPTDDAVTFLAVRHHLTEAALRAGLDRGALAARKPIEWLTIAGRPVGLRRRPAAAALVAMDRDDRIVALPRAELAIMATPAYASLLLGVDPLARPADAADAGAPDAQLARETRTRPMTRARWLNIAGRIEAEEAALPDDAAFMMMATGLFAPVDRPTGYVVPPTHGTNDDQPPQPTGSEPSPPPQVVTMTVGLDPPYFAASAEFATEAEADRWERDLPYWRRKLASNPLVLLGGFASLIGRAETSREGNTLQLRVATSIEELQRLLNLAANLTRAAQQARLR
jgi:hypothetical protein